MEATKHVRTFENFDKEEEEKESESSKETIKRIWDVIDSGDFFCVISSYNSGDPESLEGDYEELKNDVLRLKYAYLEQNIAYSYCPGVGQTTVKRKSLFVPLMQYDELLALGKKYNQETIAFGGNGGVTVVRVADEGVILEIKAESMKLCWNFLLNGQQNIPW